MATEIVEKSIALTSKESVEKTEGKVILKSGEIKMTEGTLEKVEKQSLKNSLHKTRLAKARLFIRNQHQFIKVGQYKSWLMVPGNYNKLRIGYDKSGYILNYNLRKVMGENYEKYANYAASEAHHIVSADNRYPSSQISQNILKRFNIDINDPMNGIILPQNSLSVLKGPIHNGGHIKEYNDLVLKNLLTVKTKDECYEVLDRVKNDLMNGEIHLYHARKRNTIKSSFN